MLKRCLWLMALLIAFTGCSSNRRYREFGSIKSSGTLNVAVITLAIQEQSVREKELDFIDKFAADQGLTAQLIEVSSESEAFEKLAAGEADVAVGEILITTANEGQVTLSLPILREDVYAATGREMPVFTMQDMVDYQILVVGQKLNGYFLINASSEELYNTTVLELEEALPQIAYKNPTAVVLLERHITEVTDKYGQNVRIEHITNFPQFQYSVAMARENYTVKSAIDDYIYNEWEQSLRERQEES